MTKKVRGELIDAAIMFSAFVSGFERLRYMRQYFKSDADFIERVERYQKRHNEKFEQLKMECCKTDGLQNKAS